MPRTSRPLTWSAKFAALLGAATLAALAPACSEDRPGDFDYYTLVLSWSPSYCAERGDDDRSPQCSGARPYAFVLHGLWPQYERGWPQFCRTRERPWVPRRVIDRMLDIMPSPRLVIHEYRKHGTCSGLPPEEYYDVSRRLFASITIPDRYRRPADPIRVSPQALMADFLRVNPELKPDMMAVSCRRNRLRELRVCFTRGLRPRPCGGNESQRRLCASDSVIMPPVRLGRRNL